METIDQWDDGVTWRLLHNATFYYLEGETEGEVRREPLGGVANEAVARRHADLVRQLAAAVDALAEARAQLRAAESALHEEIDRSGRERAEYREIILHEEFIR